VYKHPSGMLPKEYYFKVAKVTGKPGAGGKEAPRKTISKVKINLASFCAGDTEPAPQDVFLQLKCARPAGLCRRRRCSRKSLPRAPAAAAVAALSPLASASPAAAHPHLPAHTSSCPPPNHQNP